MFSNYPYFHGDASFQSYLETAYCLSALNQFEASHKMVCALARKKLRILLQTILKRNHYQMWSAPHTRAVWKQVSNSDNYKVLKVRWDQNTGYTRMLYASVIVNSSRRIKHEAIKRIVTKLWKMCNKGLFSLGCAVISLVSLVRAVKSLFASPLKIHWQELICWYCCHQLMCKPDSHSVLFVNSDLMANLRICSMCKAIRKMAFSSYLDQSFFII